MDSSVSSPEKEEDDNARDGSSSGGKDLQDTLRSLSDQIRGYDQDRTDQREDLETQSPSPTEQLFRDIHEVVHGPPNFASCTHALEILL